MIPKYIQKKVLRRAELQTKANSLQIEIEEWCAKKGIELSYSNTHVALYVEPIATFVQTEQEINEQYKQKEERGEE